VNQSAFARCALCGYVVESESLREVRGVHFVLGWHGVVAACVPHL
jgi:hypothetical protein